MDNHQQKDYLSSMLSASQDQQNLFPSFPTNAATLPQSPNGHQLNMGLLNNLMQMQGLDTSTTPASSSLNMAAFDPQLLEQQIKLTQLQQLQQLQNQIFQQQIALISGQSSSSSPLVNPTRQAGGGGDQYTGLPTPGPSGEIRPQRPSMDFTPSASLGNYMEPLPHPYLSAVSSSQNNHQSQDTNTNIPQHTRQGSNSRPMNPSLQRQLQALSNSQHPQYSTSQHHQHSASSPNFQPTSPLHSVPVSPMQHPLSSPNPFGGQQQHGHPFNGINTYSQGRFQTPHSAPESVAFHIYSEAMMGSGGSSIPGLTLGPAVDRGRGGSGGGPILDQDISPLTSPWLGARPTGGSSAGSSLSKVSTSKSRNLGSKRTASSSGDEGGSARKKPSPAIRPTPTLAMTAVRRQAEERERDKPSNSPSDSVSLRNKSMTPPSGVAGKSSLQEENMVNSNHNHNPPMSSSASAGSAPGSGSVSPNPLSSDATRVGINDMFGATMQPSSSSNNGGIEKKQRPYRGSKSTNSTPLLRSTVGGSSSSSSHARSKSTRATASAGGGAYGQSVQDSPSPVDLNVGYENESGRHDRSMMPPPPPPQSARLDGANGAEAGDENHESNANLEMELRGMGVSGMDMGMGMDMNMNMGMGMDFEGMMGVVDLNSHQEQHRLGVGGGGGVSGVMNEEGMDMSGMDQMAGHMDMGMGGMDMDGMSFGGPGGASNGGVDGMDGMGMMSIDFGHGHAQDHQQQAPTTSSSSASGAAAANQGLLMPVTPASIMNLGRLGISGPSSTAGNNNRLPGGGDGGGTSTISAGTSAPPASTRSTSTTRKSSRKEASAAGTKTKESLAGSGTGATTRSGRAAAPKKVNLVSPGLKPLLPAGGTTVSSLDATLPPPITGSSPNTPYMNASAGPSNSAALLATGPRKTSHKAAEQKRRDSLKTTFDDLRKLLPPIALPNDADVDPSMITSPLFHPTTPLLPGALPPRGPPKAGGEGPNKGVSKLQLLICGNEYIRLLKGRVERRDEEIERLRREVGRLRVVVEESGVGGMEGEPGEGEVVDLEKDLDACEKVQVRRAVDESKMANGGSANGSRTREEGVDEGDDDDDD